jgi:hypothetical protein
MRNDLATFYRSVGSLSGKLDLASLLLPVSARPNLASLLLPVSARPNLASLLGPWAELDVSFRQHEMMPLQQLGELHQREANLLRQFASKEPPRARTRISRHRQRREHVAFIVFMADAMRQLCGSPQYAAVAVMTNIAYSKANATAEYVRAACRPSTRSGRAAAPPVH